MSEERRTSPGGIPLQDLSQGRGSSQSPASSPSRIRRSFQRSRSLFQNNNNNSTGLTPGDAEDGGDEGGQRGRRSPSNSAYERVPQDSDSPVDERGNPLGSGGDIPRITTQMYEGGREPRFDDEGGMDVDMDTMRRDLRNVLQSEVDQGSSWLPGHARIGSRSRASPSGTPRSGSLSPRRPRASSNASQQGHARKPSDNPSMASEDSDFLSTYYRPTSDMVDESDTIALTDPMHLQPISGAPSSPTTAMASGPRGRKRSSSNVRFSSRSPSSRLGDGLQDPERGMRSRSTSVSDRHSRNKSLSVPGGGTSPVRRVSVAVQNMSQRVVNLSNDPNTNIARRPSTKSLKTAPGDVGGPEITIEDEEGNVKNATPGEKPIFGGIKRTHVEAPWRQNNPLRGHSLNIFGPENPLRVFLCDVLVHPVTEPFILLLIIFQLALLTVDSAKNVFGDRRDKAYGTTWADYAMTGLFIFYTIEILARSIVSGFINNARNPGDPPRRGFMGHIRNMYERIFLPYENEQKKQRRISLGPPQPGILRSFTGLQQADGAPAHTVGQQRHRLARRAFMRHSFNRLDFVAVVSYWISFLLTILSIEANGHVYVFRMMSCLRILRLLGITSGMAVILRSVKKAAPLLLNVAFLIGFFWLIFAIIGVQCFKSSFRRTCVWVDPTGLQENFKNELQFCGGHLDISGVALPFVQANGQPAPRNPKGYICPINSLCLEQDNPYGGTVSFDNIFQSLELSFVIMSANQFSNIMYYAIDSDYLAASIYFIIGVIILSFWLMNLLVAVITSSFQVIREEEGKDSAFTDREAEDEDEEDAEIAPPRRVSKLKTLYDKTEFVWVLTIMAGLLASASKSADMSSTRANIIDSIEVAVTALLVMEILLRFVADWRGFHTRWRNWIDLGLAIATAVIQLPFIKNSGAVYNWLTIFQILRFYRVVIFIPITRNLLKVVVGNAAGLLNLFFFTFFITFLCAIFAVQLIRGDIPGEDDGGEEIRFSFYNVWNSFLGMYLVLSSENWTDPLYNATKYQKQFGTGWISAIFFIAWFFISFGIILNLFIAVISENFDVSEDEKRVWQIRSFLQRKHASNTTSGNLSLSSLFGFGRSEKDPIEYGHAGIDMLTKEAVVEGFLDEQGEGPTIQSTKTMRFDDPNLGAQPQDRVIKSSWSRFASIFTDREENPFATKNVFETTRGDIAPTAMAQELARRREQTKRAQREYLLKNPIYNVSLFIFRPSNKIRRLCQRMVGPSHGSQRFDGVPPYRPLWYTFSAVVYCAIIAMVIIACITTPLYQKNYFDTHGGFNANNWFTWADFGFACLFSLEAVIKIVADGLFWTPNAYLRNIWGWIDILVLSTLWISVGASLGNETSISRAVGAFKALRALRLLNVSDTARETFNSMLLGSKKLISAAFVSLALLIPFAMYGLNLYSGQFVSCNDGGADINNLNDCVFEYASSPYNWNVLAPRAASNPWFDFDDFGSGLFTLFQITSEEGWSDVMWQAMSITGVGNQPKSKAKQEHAIVFVIFNLLSSVFVATLFVSVFMRNYTEQTGVAFLTADQRSWLELRKILRQVRPSKRPVDSPDGRFKAWCYNRAIRKHGRWNSFITSVLLLHLILLVVEFYPAPQVLDTFRDMIFLFFTLIYIVNIVVRLTGLTAKQYFKSRWDVFGFFVVGGTFFTTITLLVLGKRVPVFTRFQKLFLVADTLLLIPRNNQLDQLFKTAAASLGVIGNLMITWLVLFLVFAIALTQSFGLTRVGDNGSGTLNFRNITNAMIVLFKMITGEAWDQVMDDFSVTAPNCVSSEDFFQSDCGSKGYARTLFVAWNIISMYIFLSMFTAVVVDSFSYVYQEAGSSSRVSREEIRRFKKAWSKYDPFGTGYIPRKHFSRFLGDLSGAFTMRIYEEPLRIKDLLAECRIPPQEDKAGFGVDLNLLNRRLLTIPVWRVQRQRKVFQTFFQECLVGTERSGTVPFTNVLITLAHYKVIVDNKSLKLEEYLRRRAKLQMVAEQIQRDTVKSFFLMLIEMQRYRKMRRTATMMPRSKVVFAPPRTPDHGPSMPSILVQTESTPSFEIPQEPTTPISPHTPIPRTPPGGSPPSPSPIGRGSLRHWRKPSASASPEQQGEEVRRESVMDDFQNSPWGGAMRRSVSHARRRSSLRLQPGSSPQSHTSERVPDLPVGRSPERRQRRESTDGGPQRD